MEEKLKALIEANDERNRYRWAKSWKEKGGKVIGVISSYVPEEVLSAAGILPFRLTGTWSENIDHARIYRPENSCGFCNHLLESFLRGEFDFLDGVVAADIDQDVIRLLDVLLYLKKVPFCHIIHVPFTDTSELHFRFFSSEIERLADKLGELVGKRIAKEAIFDSIRLYDKIREKMLLIYEMRKKDHPPLSGKEVLGLMTGITVMPRDEVLSEIENIFQYLQSRKTNLKSLSPRIMILSDMLDCPAYLELIEDEGCIVVMDDMDTGVRYIDLPAFDQSDDPFYVLSRRYLKRHGSARMATWGRQMKNIVDWVSEFRVDGVLGLPLAWCYPQQYRMPYVAKRLEEESIPHLFLDREYHFSNVGQLRTRIGAFIESLKERGK